MAKRRPVTQELTNIYPPWSRTREDSQSIGYRLLNSMAGPLDSVDRALAKMRANQFLLTANMNEIGQIHRVALPTTFTFDEDVSDPAGPVPTAPTVSGLVDSTYYEVPVAAGNDIESFWYDSIPSRATLDDTVTGDHNLVELTASDYCVSGEWSHHLGGGDIFVEADGGTQYLQVSADELRRAKLILHGTTRFGLTDQETIIFPWDQRQKSLRQWKTLTKIEARDVEPDVVFTIASAEFEEEDYLDKWNLEWSPQRKKIDTFWGLDSSGGKSYLEKVRYTSDEWEQLILGVVEKEASESWELLDSSWATVTAVDMALQPFTERAWIVDDANILYCYDAISEMVSGVNLLRDRTDGTHVQIDIEERWVLQGESIDFIPWYRRPIQELLKYRVWYQQPDGDKYYWDGSAWQTWIADSYIVDRGLVRTLTNVLSVTASNYGEYLLGLDAVYVDETEHSDRVLVSVNHRLPLATIDLSSLVLSPILGIDFDADQKMWVRTASSYYQIGLHTDIMLIDYQQKLLYFKEDYSEVTVETDG